MKSSTTNEVLLEDNGQPVLHKSVMTPDNELYLKVNNNKLQFKHQMSDAFVDLSTTLDLPEIVQVTGTSTDKVMSQKAVTDVINENVNRIDGDIGSLDATKADADSVVNKTDIVQSTGSSETLVMSQKSVTNMLAQKASYSSLLNLDSSVSTIKNTTIPELRKVVDDNKLEADRTTADLTEKINTINDTTIPAINKTITDNVNRIDGDIGSLDATKADAAAVINKTDIVHQPGTANDKVMSQNTTTYNLNLKVDKTAIVQTAGNATDKIMSQDAVTKALASAGTDIQVVQTTGTSQTDVMSQKAVTDQVNLKLDKTALAPSTGNGTDVTMTQKAITEFVNSSVDAVGTVLTRFEKDIEDNRVNIDQLTVSNSTLVDDVTALKTNKADKTSVLLKADIAQGTGNSTTKVMSQDAVTKALNEMQPKGDYALKTEIPKNLSQLTNDSRFIHNGEIVNLDKALIFTATTNPYIKMYSGSNYSHIQAYNNKLLLGSETKGLHIEMVSGNIIAKNNFTVEGSLIYKGKEVVDLIYPNKWIVQSYKSSDGNVKWRKWNDGLIEYWINMPNGVSSHTFTGINFTNTNYSVFVGLSGIVDSAIYYSKLSIKTKNTNSISFYDVGVAGITRYIYVVGY